MDDLAGKIAPTGRLRGAINLGNGVLARAGQAGPEGVSVDLAREIGRRLGLPVELLPVDAAPKSVALVRAGEADIGFFAIDPTRGDGIAFTDPIVIIEGVFLVRNDAPFLTPADVDRPGVRVGAGRGSAYALHLARSLKSAQLMETATSREVVPQVLAEGWEVAAGIRAQMEADAAVYSGLRVLPEAFMVIRQAVGMPAGRGLEAVEALRRIVTDLRDSGAVADAMRRHGVEGARAAEAGE